MGTGAGGAAQPDTYVEGMNIGPPPDLPSLLLHNRIVYIGMPLVPAVAELVIAELLYLNYEDQTRPVTMYINSSGTTANGQSVGYETEAFAIAERHDSVEPASLAGAGTGIGHRHPREGGGPQPEDLVRAHCAGNGKTAGHSSGRLSTRQVFAAGRGCGVWSHRQSH